MGRVFRVKRGATHREDQESFGKQDRTYEDADGSEGEDSPQNPEERDQGMHARTGADE